MQNRLIREGIHIRCTGWSVLPVANLKSVFESGIEKGETCVLPSRDTCLTKLKKVRHLSDQAEKDDRNTGWQHGNKGHNHYFEVSKPVWMVPVHSISTEKRYHNAPDPLGPPL